MFAYLGFVGVPLLALAAAPDLVELPVPIEPYPGRSIAVDPRGEVHVVGRLRKGAAERGCELVYFRTREGQWQEEPIPPPTSYGEEWGDNDFVEASIAIDGDGQPMIAFTEDWQPGPGEHETALFFARRGQRGWKTVQLDSYSGLLRSVTLSAYDGGWTLAAISSSEWSGIVRWGPSEGPVQWSQASRLASELVLVEGGYGQSAFYRVLDDVFFVGPDGQKQQVSSGAARQLSAVATDSAIHWLRYDPGRERPYAGHIDITEAESPSATSGAPIDVQEAGWYNSSAVAADGTPLTAWYYRRNPFNKGLMVATLGADGRWQPWVQIRSEENNVGFSPTIAAGPDGTIALAALDRSERRMLVERYTSIDEAKAAAVQAAGDWTDRHRKTEIFVYGGGWLQGWSTAMPSPSEAAYEEDAERIDTDILLQPGLGLQGGLAGRVGRFDLALEYLERRGGKLAETVDKLENLAGKVGIDKFPFAGSSAQVHFRSVQLSGLRDGIRRDGVPTEVSERELQIRYLGKGDWYGGLGYRVLRTPQDLYRVKDGRGDKRDTVLASWRTDARLSTLSILAGRSIIDYLGRYEIRRFGPFFDSQVGFGLVDGRFSAGEETLDASGLSFHARGDAGIVVYRRFRELMGAGLFAQAGLRGEGAAIFVPSRDGEIDLVFSRGDGRFGPFLNVGALF